MEEFEVNDRVVISNYGWEPEAETMNGHEGVVTQAPNFPFTVYYRVVLDSPVDGHGTVDNPALLAASEISKVSE